MEMRISSRRSWAAKPGILLRMNKYLMGLSESIEILCDDMRPRLLETNHAVAGILARMLVQLLVSGLLLLELSTPYLELRSDRRVGRGSKTCQLSNARVKSASACCTAVAVVLISYPVLPDQSFIMSTVNGSLI